ncbi:L,D-transpeptidase [Streptacidiphilus sp. ASG 303]|uniref:L,D-transpeptidase n=1 Tax=Streptomycetaceae TaxID=2062 RepID=UPI001E458DD7|nr:L,D-transpeptidase [Streptacidiphilus sp. ASG 303]MCD0486223.1 L,D-transpeptidase [Streptacidiphilus sp. ASG 303]
MTRNRLRGLRRAAASGALATLLTTALCAAAAGPAAGAPARQAASPVRAPAAATGHVTVIDARTHQLRATVDGRTVAVFAAGFGQPRFPTRSGTYHVLGKEAVVEMTSCSIRLTCNPASPDYYDVMAPWAVRLTDSGLFVHGAPWDHSIGSADISHGCVHLGTAAAKWFYDFSRVGDTVIVTGT